MIEACPNIKIHRDVLYPFIASLGANVGYSRRTKRGDNVSWASVTMAMRSREYVISELVRLLHGFGGKQWKHKAYELGGQKVGIVGLGRTGRMIADALRFLGAEGLLFQPYP